MRHNVHDVIGWLHSEVHNPSQNWQAMCLRSARMAWGLPVIAPSARTWWAKVPEKHRHHAEAATDVPAGAMCYAPLGHWGHAWIMGHHGHAFSTDYHRRGRIDWVKHGALSHWTHTNKVWWTDWTPKGMLPLDHPHR